MPAYIIQQRARLDGGDDATAAFGEWSEHSRFDDKEVAHSKCMDLREAEPDPAGWMKWRVFVEGDAP